MVNGRLVTDVFQKMEYSYEKVGKGKEESSIPVTEALIPVDQFWIGHFGRKRRRRRISLLGEGSSNYPEMESQYRKISVPKIQG